MRGTPYARSWRSDRKAIGGFIEAMLAVMVVTCGVFLLSTSIVILSDGWRNDTNDQVMKEFCNEIMSDLIEDNEIMIEDSLIDLKMAETFSERYFDQIEGQQGALVFLEDLNEGKIHRILESGKEWNENQTRYSRSEPVNIRISSLDVRPGLLVVMVW
jgi:hypothetical protein